MPIRVRVRQIIDRIVVVPDEWWLPPDGSDDVIFATHEEEGWEWLGPQHLDATAKQLAKEYVDQMVEFDPPSIEVLQVKWPAEWLTTERAVMAEETS